MAKIIVGRDQQAEMQRLHPKPAYSRVINLTLQIPAGIGFADFAISPPVGNRIWLLGVSLITMSQTRANVFGGFIYITTGTQIKQQEGSGPQLEDNVIRNYGGPKPGFYYTGFGDSYHWDMMMFYEGSGRRFGAMAENLFATETWRAWISFEISEG